MQEEIKAPHADFTAEDVLVVSLTTEESKTSGFIF